MNKKIKIIVSILVLTSTLFFGACGNKKGVSDKSSENNTTVSQNESKTDNKNVNNKKNANNKEVKKEEKKVDKEVTKKVKDESQVEEANVYFSDGSVKGAIILKKGTSASKAKEIAEKYADELKAKYKDKDINVQAVSDGKNLANVSK